MVIVTVVVAALYLFVFIAAMIFITVNNKVEFTVLLMHFSGESAWVHTVQAVELDTGSVYEKYNIIPM
mgnify:FL=1